MGDLEREDGSQTRDVVVEVTRLLGLARSRGASDLHLEPTAEGLTVRMRLDSRRSMRNSPDPSSHD